MVCLNVGTVIDRDSALWGRLRAWPKVELHRHLEGSIRLSTLIDIAREFDLPLPSTDPERLRPLVQITDDDEPTCSVFLSKFETLRQFYHSPDVVRRITHEAIEDAARDNVTYMELRFTPAALARHNGHDYETIIGTVCDAARHAQAAYGITVRLIVSVNRHESVDTARAVIQAALALRPREVVAVDLAGKEIGYPVRPFEPLFRRAREAGLHLTVHAGEWDGPHNVGEAVRHMGAERIGHGVRIAEDPAVIRLVRERGVTLEVCPTSNLYSGVVGSLATHPLIDLAAQGVLTTINTDDPALCNIALTDELMVAHVALGLSLDAIRENIVNAARAAFLPDGERAALVARIRAALGVNGAALVQ